MKNPMIEALKLTTFDLLGEEWNFQEEQVEQILLHLLRYKHIFGSDLDRITEKPTIGLRYEWDNPFAISKDFKQVLHENLAKALGERKTPAPKTLYTSYEGFGIEEREGETQRRAVAWQPASDLNPVFRTKASIQEDWVILQTVEITPTRLRFGGTKDEFLELEASFGVDGRLAVPADACVGQWVNAANEKTILKAFNQVFQADFKDGGDLSHMLSIAKERKDSSILKGHISPEMPF